VRTTIVIRLIGYREVILGHKILSGIVGVFCTGKNKVVKIVHSSSEMVL
jgi:hypothetical protein